MGQSGLAQTRRTEQQNMIERFFALPRRLNKNLQLAARFFLADIFVEHFRAQRALLCLFLRRGRGRGNHAIGFNHDA